jgi:transposase
VTLQAYRFALDPTSAQERLLWSHCGTARVAFNRGLAHVKAVTRQREAETTCGIGKEDMTATVSWSLYPLRREWNAAKPVSRRGGASARKAFNAGLDNLARSLKNWGDFRCGKRRGAPVGFPRFKSRHHSRLPVRFELEACTGTVRPADPAGGSGSSR